MEKPNIPTINRRKSNLELSSSATFLLPNGENSKDFDIEMIQIQPLTYTSLRDLLPSSSSAGLLSPTQKSSSWKEISIKNPLVKHAARAYLQPMSSAPDVDDKGLFQRLKDQCGCIEWFNDVVLKPLRVKFLRGEEISDDGEEDDYLRREQRGSLTQARNERL